MRKRIVKIVVCAVVLTTIAVALKFTYAGQKFLYDTFGGNNLHLILGEKELFWFDAWHSNDPNDPMFERIENSFNSFNPDLVLVEGGFNMFEGNRDEAISEGESSFTVYLANQNNVTVEDIEPTFAAQIAYLQSRYEPEQILAMYHIRQIGSMLNEPVDTDFDFNDYLISETQYFIDNGLEIEVNSLDEILEIINSYLPQSINSETWRTGTGVSDVYNDFFKGKGVLSPIYLDIYNFRNRYLVELIQKRQVEYNRIFIVMGGQHLIDTKEQLRELYSVP